MCKLFSPIELKQDYVCGLISFDSYHTIPNVDEENNLFHFGSSVFEIPVGTYELGDIVEKITNTYEPLNRGFINIKANPNTFRTEIMSYLWEVNFNKKALTYLLKHSRVLLIRLYLYVLKPSSKSWWHRSQQIQIEKKEHFFGHFFGS